MILKTLVLDVDPVVGLDSKGLASGWSLWKRAGKEMGKKL